MIRDNIVIMNYMNTCHNLMYFYMKTTNTKNTPLSAANTIKMIEIIRESAENSGKTIKL